MRIKFQIIVALFLTLSLTMSGNAQSDARAGASLEYIAHAAFVLQSPLGKRVLIDPYQDRVWIGYDFPLASIGDTIDAVAITHPHYDHDMGRFRGATLPWGGDVSIFDKPGRYQIGDVILEGVKGRHAEPYGAEFGKINTIFKLTINGITVTHLGDNRPLTDEEIEAVGGTDILLIPVDDKEHLLSFDAIAAAIKALSPKIVIPMHYRLNDLETERDKPEDLGGIEGWLSRQKNVRDMKSYQIALSRDMLPRQREIWHLQHSPQVTRPKS